MQYSFNKILDMSFDDAVDSVNDNNGRAPPTCTFPAGPERFHFFKAFQSPTTSPQSSFLQPLFFHHCYKWYTTLIITKSFSILFE